MNSIFPWLGIAVLILCGWAIVKKYQVNMVLLLGGLILNLLAFWGGAEIFPKKFSATGILGFALVALMRTISVSQVSGVGFLILFSALMPVAVVVGIALHSLMDGKLRYSIVFTLATVGIMFGALFMSLK